MHTLIFDMRVLRTWTLTFLSVLTLSASALAQPAADAARSDALVSQGVELRRSGDDEGALRVFAEAYEINHSPRARAQMALAEQALGHFVQAEAHLMEALAAQNDAWIDARRDALQDSLATIRTRLGSLELRGGIEGAQVKLDGIAVATLPLTSAIRSPVGTFRLEITAPGYYAFVRQVTIVAEGTTRETVEMTATPSSGTSVRIDEEATSAASRRRRNGALAFTLMGTGVASMGASLGTFIVRENAAEAWNSDDCLVNGLSRAENCGPERDRARRAGNASIATLAIGGSLVATGVILLLTRPHDAPQQTSFSCGAFVGRTSGGSCAWQF